MDQLPLDQLSGMNDMQEQQQQVLNNNYKKYCISNVLTTQAAAMDEQRLSILDQILEPAAKDRLLRLSIVKKEKATRVEASLIQAATTGKLRGKVYRQK